MSTSRDSSPQGRPKKPVLPLAEIYNKSVVAQLYYAEKGFQLSKEQARKRFDQDKKIDTAALKMILKP